MKHHLIIGGTGRAGTTFLVQYLAACGLETQLAKSPHPGYDEAANAGLEDVPMGHPDLPYVVKSPWLYEYVGRLLDDREIAVDAVILPMRGIVEAATSRVVNELRARHAIEGLPPDCGLWESWGTTPGGVVYSLSPIDQARLLAMGFHELVHALVRRDVPLVLLDFPRCVEDADYLYDKLRPVLEGRVERARALEAFRESVAPGKVRIARELAIDDTGPRQPREADARAPGLEFPSHAALDRVALRRELDRLRGRVAQLEGQLASATSKLTAIEASTTWRATAPARALSGLLRSVWSVANERASHLRRARLPAAPPSHH